jgi:hypothetical protein
MFWKDDFVKELSDQATDVHLKCAPYVRAQPEFTGWYRSILTADKVFDARWQ